MNIVVCDDCGDRNKVAARVWLHTGIFESDPAGGASTERYEVVDLCLACAIIRLKDARRPAPAA